MTKVLHLLPAVLFVAAGYTYAESWVSLDQGGTQADSAPSPKPIQLAQTTISSSQSSPAPSSDALQLMYEEIEILKQEVQTLRGLVEEQGHELKKLKNEQKERYIELDRRMSQVIQQNGSSVATVSASVKGDEKSQYDLAFQLVKDKKFTDALKAMQAFLKQYPKSKLAVNAYYWIGQVYFIQGQYDEARQAFTIIVEQFPDHQKAADSTLKLGRVFHQLGEELKAEKTLRQVIERYSETAPGTARLAEKYLNKHFK